MKNIILIFVLLISIFVSSQTKNDSYKSFSNSTRTAHIIKFENDSIVTIQNVMSHMSGRIALSGIYHKVQDTIYISIPELDQTKMSEANKFGLAYLSGTKIKLIETKTELLNFENDAVYVRSKIYGSNRVRRKTITFINGKKYLVDGGLTDSYGLIKSESKKNAKFMKAVEEMIKIPEDYSIKKYGLIEGYQKFGVLAIKGVIDYRKKNNL
ncbi:hypothetical protein [Flavobacterium sp. HJJ]|uniref:hypothetical protein n=1 Tax=Flavobacterium sp. HJJ TaxID=2783792 RepID=UPI00188B5C6B|nr:hypothetical protein [Flavobacterium sp. HJJ]MBF4472236.1 hypothetical protein [Flavobacterium sp. HJJ]